MYVPFVLEFGSLVLLKLGLHGLKTRGILAVTHLSKEVSVYAKVLMFFNVFTRLFTILLYTVADGVLYTPIFPRRRIGFDAVMLVIFKCVNKKKSGKISMISLSGNVMYIYFVY